MVAKRQAPFKAKYGVELGLRVKERDPDTSEVLTATCLFCQLFGRENKPGAQRRATEKVAMFKLPFRKDSIQIHHVGQHPTKWAEYCALSSADSKRAYFIAAGASMELDQGDPQDPSRPRKTQRTTSRVLLQYAASSVPAGQTYQHHAMGDFDDMVNFTESGTMLDMLVARYRIVLKDPAQFQQFVDFLNTSGSLKNTAKMLHVCSQPVVVGPFFHEERDISEINVAQYARFLCAINFQRIATIAKNAGVYSIGLKVAPIAPASFFEAQVEYCLHVQLRVFVDGQVECFHVLSIPLNKRRRSDVDGSSGVFEIAEKALNAIVPRWQDAMIAVISDSDGITPQESDDPRLSLRNAVASRFVGVSKPGFLRVCSAVHQLDSLMQTFVMKIIGGDEVYSKLTTLIAFLNHQHKLLDALETTVPIIGDNKWKSVVTVAMWLRRHGITIREHFEMLQSSFAPPSSWWIRVLLTARIGQEVMAVLEKISGLTTAASKPRDEVVQLSTFLMNWFSISGPLEINDPAVEAATASSRSGNSAISSDGKYSINANDVFTALEDMGSFITEAIQTAENVNEISQSEVETTVNEIANSVVNLVAGLNAIKIDIDGTDAEVHELPAVLPHEIVKMRGRQFTAVIRPQVERLRLAGWSRQEIDWIEQDFQDLCGAYFRDSSLKLALDKCSNNSSFRDAWGCLHGRFTHLERLCGIMTTTYPTAGNNGYCTSCATSLAPITRVASLPGDLESGVLDLSVQAALHAKQFWRLQNIKQ
ncbi:hypothetical protein PHMEG_0007872 [Phytophthora megakarya]|uniref:Uncharacterized protein n=1 Tax=Phytophthora megakarya TaxID=4795 RepID=A0A225WKC4_9STRA|nr:hypothetical protein PHMEG_0007872 [Phytophthora megakarya]